MNVCGSAHCGCVVHGSVAMAAFDYYYYDCVMSIVRLFYVCTDVIVLPITVWVKLVDY